MRCSSYSESLYVNLATISTIQNADWLPIRSAKHLIMLSNRIICLVLSILEVAIIATPRAAAAPMAKLFGKRDFFILNEQVQSAKKALTQSLHGPEPQKKPQPPSPQESSEDPIAPIEEKVIQFVKAHQREIATAVVVCIVAYSIFVLATSKGSVEEVQQTGEGFQDQISEDLTTLIQAEAQGQSSQISDPFSAVALRASSDPSALTIVTSEKSEKLNWPATSSREIKIIDPQPLLPVNPLPYLPYLGYAAAAVGICLLLKRGVHIHIYVQGEKIVVQTAKEIANSPLVRKVKELTTPLQIPTLTLSQTPNSSPPPASKGKRTSKNNRKKSKAKRKLFTIQEQEGLTSLAPSPPPPPPVPAIPSKNTQAHFNTSKGKERKNPAAALKERPQSLLQKIQTTKENLQKKPPTNVQRQNLNGQSQQKTRKRLKPKRSRRNAPPGKTPSVLAPPPPALAASTAIKAIHSNVSNKGGTKSPTTIGNSDPKQKFQTLLQKAQKASEQSQIKPGTSNTASTSSTSKAQKPPTNVQKRIQSLNNQSKKGVKKQPTPTLSRRTTHPGNSATSRLKGKGSALPSSVLTSKATQKRKPTHTQSSQLRAQLFKQIETGTPLKAVNKNDTKSTTQTKEKEDLKQTLSNALDAKRSQIAPSSPLSPGPTQKEEWEQD